MEDIKYDKYSAYKPTGVDWLGEIPEHWLLKPSKRFHVVKKQINTTKESENVLSLTLRGVVNNDPDSPEGLVPKDYRTYQLFEKNNLVFKLIDLENVKTSRVGIVHENGIMSSAYIRLIIGSNTIPRYAFYYFYNLYLNEVYNNLGSGVRSTLGPNDLLNLPFICPSKEEQIAIVTFLDQKTAKIEQAIAIKEKQIELLKERKQIIIQQAVNKGLNPHEKMKYSGVEWIGEIPEHWEVWKLTHLTKLLVDGTHFSPKSYSEGEYKYITAKNIKESGFDFSNISYVSKKDHNNIYPRCPVQKNDILYIKDGATAGIAMVNDLDEEFSLLSSVALIRPNTEIISEKYLNHFLNSQIVRNFILTQIVGGAITRLTLELISSFKIIVPSEEEQTAIVSYIEKQFIKFDKAISLQEQQIEKLKEYKTVLVDAAVTGKIKIC